MMNASNILHAAEGLFSSAKDKVGSVLSDRKLALKVGEGGHPLSVSRARKRNRP
jgi:hypothetical protein